MFQVEVEVVLFLLFPYATVYDGYKMLQITMSWKLLKILYPIAMVPFSVSLWFVKTPVNNAGLDWKDFDHLRVICLLASFAFWILSLISLMKRHRSFPLLWGGTILVASAMLVLPAPPVTALNRYLQAALFAGLSAHLALLYINDRCLPRLANTSES